MALQIEKSFVVKAAPDIVWAFLTDPHRVANCLPGAAITEQVDAQTHAGTITVKIGPVSTSYKGNITFERLDPDAREVEIVGLGQDVRGKGGAEMRMNSRLTERAPGETEVMVTSNINVTGMLVQFGQRMIQDVADQMFQQFATAMRDQLEAGTGPAAAERGAAAPTAAEAINIVALGATAGRRMIGRTLRQPVFWAIVVALITAIYLLFFR
ncbi:MAG: SRPBCC family protein [Gammaproteobacteria bacterium]|nr:SRPBCC family protein [Gammaproteobacteria bacterium]